MGRRENRESKTGDPVKQIEKKRGEEQERDEKDRNDICL